MNDFVLFFTLWSHFQMNFDIVKDSIQSWRNFRSIKRTELIFVRPEFNYTKRLIKNILYSFGTKYIKYHNIIINFFLIIYYLLYLRLKFKGDVWVRLRARIVLICLSILSSLYKTSFVLWATHFNIQAVNISVIYDSTIKDIK